MKLLAIALVAALSSVTGVVSADDARALPLASVAHRLGLIYTYLGSDDEVSLTGHGVAVIVRPGSSFFSVNDRVEPIEGDAPRYQGGDLFVSPAFAHQLGTIERAAAKNDAMRRSRTLASSDLHINAAPKNGMTHRVTTVAIVAIPGTEDVAVSGQATPGALVAIVLKADAAPELPTIYLNRSFTLAGSDGKYSVEIPTAPNYFTGSVLIAEAAGIDDATPMTASFTPPAK